MMSFKKSVVFLKFRIGELTLFSASFSAYVQKARYNEIPKEQRFPLELSEFLRDSDVVLIPSQPIETALPRLSLSSSCIRYVPQQYTRYSVRIQGSFADYLNKFSSKTRSTLKRKVRKYAEFSRGTISWREFVKPEEMALFHELARHVAVKTYQEKLLRAALPADSQFREMMQELARTGRVRAYVLFHDGKPIAYLYCPLANKTLSYDYLGHDPCFSDWSPGTILQYLVLEKLFGEGNDMVFDFTEGGGPHKELFATDFVRCADIYCFRRTTRNLMIVCLHMLVATTSRFLTRGSQFLGIKRWLKETIRGKI